jgi:glyoxylase I family protein
MITKMTISPSVAAKKLKIGQLRKVHHIAFNVKDMDASRHFYGEILGLEELVGEKIPSTLKELVAQGKVANFITPDGTVIDLFWEPDLNPPRRQCRNRFYPCQPFSLRYCSRMLRFCPRSATKSGNYYC